MLYVVARHAQGGLSYLRDDDTWTRERCLAETFPLDLAASIARDYVKAGVSGVHVRNERRQPLTCNPRGRPRSTAGYGRH